MRMIETASAAVVLVITVSGAFAAPLTPSSEAGDRLARSSLVQPIARQCRREPVWGFRISAFCKPTGICPDRVIKGYRTVCT